MPPRFTSFDDAWRWFEGGGALVPLAEQRRSFVAGRAQLLAFHARITDPRVLGAAAGALDALDGVSGILPFDIDHLHVSLRAAGFQVIAPRRDDEITRQDAARIADRASMIARRTPPAAVEIGPPNIFPDALVLEVRDPPQALAALRRELAAAASRDAFGVGDGHYLPHVSIAFFESPDAAAPLRERLPAVRAAFAPVALTLRRIELVRWWFTGDDDAAEPELDVVREYALRG